MGIIVQGLFLPSLTESSLQSLDTGHSCFCSKWLTQQVGGGGGGGASNLTHSEEISP